MESGFPYCEAFLKISELVPFLYHDETKTFMTREQKVQDPSICHLPQTKQVISDKKINNSVNDWEAILGNPGSKLVFCLGLLF